MVSCEDGHTLMDVAVSPSQVRDLCVNTAPNPRAIVVFSFALERYLTFHMQSNPTFYPIIYQTFIDVYFTRRLTLHRSIECVFRPPG